MARRGEAVKTFWIVDEQCLPRSFVWRNLGEDIDQHTVIGNWPLMVRMRPIRAPEAAVAGLRNQLARERHRIRVGWALPRNAISAASMWICKCQPISARRLPKVMTSSMPGPLARCVM